MSKFIRLFSFLAASAALLQGCGGHRELTDAEKARLSDTISSVGTSYNAVQKTSSKAGGKKVAGVGVTPKNGNALAYSPLFSLMGGFAATTGNAQREKDAAEITNRLDRAISQNDCSVPNAFPTGMPQQGAKKADMKFSVVGDKCPISLDFSATIASENNTKANVTAVLKYEVKDSGLKDLAVIDVVTLNFKGSMEQNNNGGASGNANLDGKFHSTKEGDIRAYSSADVSTDKMEVTFGLEFKDFTAEVKMVKAKDGTEKYTLNGKETTQTELQNLFKGQAPVANGGDTTGNANPPAGNKPQPNPFGGDEPSDTDRLNHPFT